MLPEKTLAWGTSRSCIRELAEYGWARKAAIGDDKVFDYSLGNPSIPAPDCVQEAIADLLKMDSVALHSYTSAPGLPSLRQKIAEDLSKRSGMEFAAAQIYVTCGAAAGLAACLRGILLPGDEVVVPAPFFPEYTVFTEASGGTVVPVPPQAEDFQVDLDAFAKALSPRTKAVIINSPNNPSGVVISAETLQAMSEILQAHEKQIGERVYLVCDEPYRELVYDGVEVPCIFPFYTDCILIYSFSKSLSIPGERIGYLAVSPAMAECDQVFASIAGAARALGYVNPPSLFQRVIERCLGATSDISQYKANRDLLLKGLQDLGYTCIEPQGAFYLFVKSPESDAKAFSERAKQYELLLVPSDDFGVPGYVRLAYCVSRQMIENSLPAFQALAKDYGLQA